MKKKIKFVKMHGLGNDFVVLDRISQTFVLEPALLARIGDRRLGIGCDQILLIDPPSQPSHDFDYRIFNANGEEVEQCGNGARCFGRYVYEKGWVDSPHIILGSLGGPVKINLEDPSCIQVCLGKPILPPAAKDIQAQAFTKINDHRYQMEMNQTQKEITLLSLGNPHCVISVSSVKDAKVNSIGKALQQHPGFPKGVNVSFVEVLARNHIKVKVYERGAGETQSCGTAACASVLAGIMQNELNANVQVDMPGGSLIVQWDPNEGIYISGSTQMVYEGSFLTNQNEEPDHVF